MFKKNWSKGLKKIFSTKGVDTLKMEIAPYRDWRILVSTFFVGLVASFGFNVYMSIKIDSDNFFATTPKSNSGVTLNEEGLTKILKELDEKSAAFEKVKNEGVAIADPSL